MSLYSMVCGNNPLYTMLHAILATEGPLPEIPRYRDTWTKIFDGKPYIVIHTRTGGGNREDYVSENKALAQHPLYRTDEDDPFDSTFADFVFAVPEKWRAKVLRYHKLLGGMPNFAPPREKFNRAMSALEGKAQTETAPPSGESVAELEQLIGGMAKELGL
jgi:hypothetical protein